MDKAEKKKKTGLSRLFEIAGEKKAFLVFSGIFSAASAILMMTPFLSVYFILAELLKNAGNLAAVNTEYMIRWGWIAFGGLILGLALNFVSLLFSHIAAFNILYEMRMKIATHLGKLSLGYLNKTSTGKIKKTVEENVEKIENFVAHSIPDLIGAFATVVVCLLITFSLNGWMAIAALAAFILGFGTQASTYVGKESIKNVKMFYDALERVNGAAVEYIRGMPAVKVFGRTVYSFRRFYSEISTYKEYATKYTDSAQRGYLIFKVLMNSFLTFILPVGLLLWDGQLATAITFLFFIVMVPGTSAPILKLTMLAMNTRMITEGVDRVDEILEEPEVVESKLNSKPGNYTIDFEDVSFSYNAEDAQTRQYALKNINLEVREGTFTALVGPSGSGKSTIANLIPRFWDVSEGSIKIGGVNIKDMKTEDLMNIVSFVFQDTFLFYDSIYENIKVGRPDATEEEVYAAAKAAQCHDFILSLPSGYDTLIGEGGVYLSGGEEQRVSVARAILKNSPILVLDEATAFADPENEYKMQIALKELIKDKTVIVIAHRLSSIVNADEIVVINEGCIVEKGTHKSLLAEEGQYKKMWKAYTETTQWQLTKNTEDAKTEVA